MDEKPLVTRLWKLYDEHADTQRIAHIPIHQACALLDEPMWRVYQARESLRWQKRIRIYPPLDKQSPLQIVLID